MSIDRRHQEILAILRAKDAVEVEELARRFHLSTQTIRQDLRDLGELGLLRRIHGGARRLATVGTRDYAERRQLLSEEKRWIGEAAAALIPDGSSLALNIGTTTEQVAAALGDHRDLMILSNNVNVITALSQTQSKELILVGGRVRQSDGAVVGEDAVEFISRYKVDYAVIGTSAMDADGSILDFDPQEVAVARAILANARTRILVADASKFEVRAPARICGIAEIDFFVTDKTPPVEFQAAARAGATDVILGKPEGGTHVQTGT